VASTVFHTLAVGSINIHVLTTLAVLGTVLLGCAMEGALLLVLFQSAHFVEDRLTVHARGDLRELWAGSGGFHSFNSQLDLSRSGH
jgi:cation transport ATPase